MAVNIVIADDHGVLRGGLRSMLNAEPDLKVIGEAADGWGALQLAQQLRPDVLLADISMPEPNGIEVTRALSASQSATRVLILTMHEDQALVTEALAAGARGYLPKRAAESELINAVRVIAGGGVFVLPTVKAERAAPAAQPQSSDVVELSDRELELLRLIVRGCTNQQTADALRMDLESTVAMRNELVQKLGVKGRVALLQYAQEHALV